MMALPIYLSTTTRFIMLTFDLLITLLLCLSYLDPLVGLTPTTNTYIMVWRWKTTESLSVVGYGYVRQLLWVLL